MMSRPPFILSIRKSTYEELVLQTDSSKNSSYCYFSSNSPTNKGSTVYVTCVHCVESFQKDRQPDSEPVGISCEKGKFEAYNSSTWALDEHRTFSHDSGDVKDQDLVEPLVYMMNNYGDQALRGFAGSEIVDGVAHQRPQRVVFGRLLSVQSSGDLYLSQVRFASVSIADIRGELQWKTGKPWAISCKTACKRLISIDVAGFNESMLDQNKSTKLAVNITDFEISADSFYEASERSIATDELGNIIVAVMRMETAETPGCSTGLDCCVVTFNFEVYRYNPATGKTQNLTRHFPYSFNEQRCTDELSGEFGYRQVHGHHALWVNRGNIYLRLGRLARYQKLFKLKYLDETAAA